MFDYLSHCRQVVAAVAPELRCQIVAAESLPPSWAPSGPWDGFAVPHITQSVAAAMGLADTVPAIVLNFDAIENVTSVLLHELSHCLPVSDRHQVVATERDLETVQSRFVAKLSNPPAVGSALPWQEDHDAAWCRRALHLWCRAEAAGFPSPLNELFGYDFQISPATMYLPAVAGEAARMMNWTFAEIETTPNPIAALWSDDVAWWKTVRKENQ